MITVMFLAQTVVLALAAVELVDKQLKAAVAATKQAPMTNTQRECNNAARLLLERNTSLLS